MAKKTPEQKAAEERRYIAACGAANAQELEPFLTDPNQAIRATAAMNRRELALLPAVEKICHSRPA